MLLRLQRGDGLAGLGGRQRLAGQDGLVALQAVQLQQPEVGGDDVPSLGVLEGGPGAEPEH